MGATREQRRERRDNRLKKSREAAYGGFDYSLLLTFAGFFIFTKTISTVPAFSNFIQSLLSSPLKTYITGIAASQVISNVPAALLLSGFTQNGDMLLLGVIFHL